MKQKESMNLNIVSVLVLSINLQYYTGVDIFPIALKHNTILDIHKITVIYTQNDYYCVLNCIDERMNK